MPGKMIKKEELLFSNEANRLRTFKKWIFPNESKCNAAKMAEAGFVFIGSAKEPDSVKCFFCNKHLDGWEKDDDPWKEHLSHSPKCEFAIRKNPEENMTLNEFLDLVDNFVFKSINDYYDAKIKCLDDNMEALEAAVKSKV